MSKPSTVVTVGPFSPLPARAGVDGAACSQVIKYIGREYEKTTIATAPVVENYQAPASSGR